MLLDLSRTGRVARIASFASHQDGGAVENGIGAEELLKDLEFGEILNIDRSRKAALGVHHDQVVDVVFLQ